MPGSGHQQQHVGPQGVASCAAAAPSIALMAPLVLRCCAACLLQSRACGGPKWERTLYWSSRWMLRLLLQFGHADQAVI